MDWMVIVITIFNNNNNNNNNNNKKAAMAFQYMLHVETSTPTIFFASLRMVQKDPTGLLIPTYPNHFHWPQEDTRRYKKNS